MASYILTKPKHAIWLDWGRSEWLYSHTKIAKNLYYFHIQVMDATLKNPKHTAKKPINIELSMTLHLFLSIA